MNRETLEKINSKLKNLDGLNRILELKGSVCLTISVDDAGRKGYFSTSAELENIKPILVAYHDQTKQELKELGYEGD